MVLTLLPENLGTVRIPKGTDFAISQYFSHGLPKPIASISLANPTVITTQGDHCLATGDKATIRDTDCCPKIELLGDVWTVTKISNTQFSIPANINLHAGISGSVIGPLMDISDYTFEGVLVRQITSSTTTSRYLDAVIDTVAGKNYATLNSNNKCELNTHGQWVSVSIEGDVQDALVQFPPDCNDSCDSFFLSGGVYYDHSKLITLSESALATLNGARILANFVTTSTIDAPSIPIAIEKTAYGRITILVPEEQSIYLGEPRFTIHATSSAGERSLTTHGRFVFYD